MRFLQLKVLLPLSVGVLLVISIIFLVRTFILRTFCGPFEIQGPDGGEGILYVDYVWWAPCSLVRSPIPLFLLLGLTTVILISIKSQFRARWTWEKT